MLVPHPNIALRPESTKKFLWRYMKYTRFQNMVAGRNLFIPRADTFMDPYECSVPPGCILQFVQDTARDYGEGELKKIPDILHPERDAGRLKMLSMKAYNHAFGRRSQLHYNFNKMRENLYISCWHMSDYDSAASWRFYSTEGDKAVAIRITPEAFSRWLDRSDLKFYFGSVNYIDFNALNPSFDYENPINAAIYKRESFDFEKEVRAIHWHEEGDPPKPEHGLTCKFDFLDVGVSVFVDPTADEHFAGKVESLVGDLGYEKKIAVVRSPLYERHLF